MTSHPQLPHLLALLMNLSLIGSAASADETTLRTIHAQASFVVTTKEVELAITKTGGHMAPVTFFRDTEKPVKPYYVSPWQEETPLAMPAPLLVPFRGDYFCMPFGGNSSEVAGEKHPPHGEIAGDNWHQVSSKKTGDVTTLTLGIDTKIRKGRVTKELSLVDGQNVIYSRQLIEGFTGKVPLGHHAMLAMPEKEGAVRIATSAFSFGMTNPGLFSDPKHREYQALQPGAKWNDLTKVPAAWKNSPDTDLTRLPGRYGYADLVQLAHEPRSKTHTPAWTTATYADEGYVWFSLKDQDVLNSLVIWMEFHGRHGHPWNGRNNCLGLEDVTAFFANGLLPSMNENILTKEGVATTVALSVTKPTAVNYIQGVIRIPAEFENVKTLEFTPSLVTFVSTTGKRVTAPIRHEFLKAGQL